MAEIDTSNDWNGNKHASFVTNGDSNHSERERGMYDYYATDPRAVEALLKRETFSKNVLEPACGGGHISNVLEENGYDVESVDIVNRGYKGQHTSADFFERKDTWNGDIVTNPPYKFAAEFVEHALDVTAEGHKIAMFLKLTFLEGEKRRKLFQNNPPYKIYVFTKRINCALNGDEEEFKKSSAVCYAWFVWKKGNKENPIIDWI